ncbi:hypothetical protein EJ07DRAFT_186282 [Lizonia empirigonia]|nr:hypothetical protein EJ07DRAFT_186282 [Lizonia empirigonia]
MGSERGVERDPEAILILGVFKMLKSYFSQRPYSLLIQKRVRVPPGTRREIASAYYQLKLGHGYNKAYLFQIGKADHPYCSCGAKQTVEHLLLSCKWYKQDRKNPPKATLAFITSTKIGTRKWHLNQHVEE